MVGIEKAGRKFFFTSWLFRLRFVLFLQGRTSFFFSSFFICDVPVGRGWHVLFPVSAGRPDLTGELVNSMFEFINNVIQHKFKIPLFARKA